MPSTPRKAGEIIPQGKSADAANQNGNRQMAIIAARKLFIADGLAGFSMRKVAKSLAMSLGHLQHYFPTRDALLVAMLEYTTAAYATAYEEIVRTAVSNPQARLDMVLRYLLDDIDNDEVRMFFVEVWPVTLRNALVADMLKRAYKSNLDGFKSFIQDVRQDLCEPRIAQLALQIVCLIDGVLVYQHTMQVNGTAVAAMKGDVLATIMEIIENAA